MLDLFDLPGAQVEWTDVKRTNLLVVKQNVPAKGPRLEYTLTWAGQVTEHSPKWTRLKRGGVDMPVLMHYGEETVHRLTKKEFNAYMKEQNA